MTRIEKSEKVAASAETLFTALKDYEHYARWNPIILDTKDEVRRLNLDGTMPFQKISIFHEKNPYMIESGEYLKTDANGKDTTVTFYVVPKDGKSLEKIHKGADIMVKSLKHYAEYLENGGKAEQYSKLRVL